ncbi:MAG: hypothetical protein AAFQ68_14400, partial [Bacteroidota bacterium]
MGTPASNTPYTHQQAILSFARCLLDVNSFEQVFQILGRDLPKSFSEGDVSIWALEKQGAHFSRYTIDEQGLVSDSAVLIEVDQIEELLIPQEDGLKRMPLPGEDHQMTRESSSFAYPIFEEEELVLVIYLSLEAS